MCNRVVYACMHLALWTRYVLCATSPHHVSAFRSFQPELPVTARPSRSRQKQNIDLRKLHRFTSNVGVAPVTDHHGWNGEAFPCPVVSVSWHLVSCTSHNQHFDFWFRPFAGKIALSSKTTGKRSHLVHFGYCHYVIKYLMRDMMNYHYLRLFRSRVRTIGKHSPGFSAFPTRVHGCTQLYSIAYYVQETKYGRLHALF